MPWFEIIMSTSVANLLSSSANTHVQLLYLCCLKYIELLLECIDIIRFYSGFHRFKVEKQKLNLKTSNQQFEKAAFAEWAQSRVADDSTFPSAKLVLGGDNPAVDERQTTIVAVPMTGSGSDSAAFILAWQDEICLFCLAWSRSVERWQMCVRDCLLKKNNTHGHGRPTNSISSFVSQLWWPWQKNWEHEALVHRPQLSVSTVFTAMAVHGMGD